MPGKRAVSRYHSFLFHGAFTGLGFVVLLSINVLLCSMDFFRVAFRGGPFESTFESYLTTIAQTMNFLSILFAATVTPKFPCLRIGWFKLVSLTMNVLVRSNP